MEASSLVEEAHAIGVELSEGQAAAFVRYRDLILEAASRFSLTALRDPAAIERRHFLESLALGRKLVDAGALPANGACRAIDIGSGAGIPGIPLKLAWPRLRISLLESNAKRCAFLRRVVEVLELTGAEVLEGRAEDWGRREGHRGAYDLAVAKAVAPLPVLLEYALPFVCRGGWLAAPKGSAAPREIDEARGALKEIGGELAGALSFEPGRGPVQTLVLVRKVAATPERYPRRAGTPAKRPLT